LKLLPNFTDKFQRREQNHVAPPEDVAALNQNNVNDVDLGGGNREVQFFLLRRSQSHRAILSSLSSVLTSAERLVEAYFRSNSLGRNQEQPPTSVDDRGFFLALPLS
jgi:E3 ubiquitin-protein ligase RNF5